MKRLLTTATALSAFAMLGLAVPASAAIPEDGAPAELILAASNGCPPGLAKKSPACVPPGLAKKIYPYAVGDRIDLHRDDIYRLRDPSVYGLARDGRYYRVGDRIAMVDPDTMKILRLIDAVSDVLN